MSDGPWRRREFLQAAALVGGGLAVGLPELMAAERSWSESELAVLPGKGTRAPVSLAHFPSRLHAFVWRNWQLVPVERMTATVGARAGDMKELARAMGLGKQPRITADQQRRSYITVIKRNWHLLPYAQLLTLLDWSPEQLAFTLREDDFLFVKLGSLKPQCAPLKFTPSDAAMRRRESEIAALVRENFPDGILDRAEPLYQFVRDLCEAPPRSAQKQPANASGQLRFCYSYFALYGDPLLEPDADPYPDGLLARLAATGVNGVWLQAVLSKLAPFPWQPALHVRYEERLKNLRKLALRARRHGIRIYLYLNEPRAMPLKFFESHPDLKGVVEGDHATLCTSVPEVEQWLRESVEVVCSAVPELGGFFTITASENLTNCWSHGAGHQCPRCRTKPASQVIAEVNQSIADGIQRAFTERVNYQSWLGRKPDVNRAPELIAWDWGWNDAWAADAIARLPAGISLMSVSEWSLPIERGGVKSQVGEYSISSVGPGPRAKRHWQFARARGLRVIAKIQAGNTWELSAVPYIPALSLVAEHAERLRTEQVDGLMLGWTLGGYPSPNLEAVGEVLAGGSLASVAARRFGDQLAPAILDAWRVCGDAFKEFPYAIGVVYSAPLQNGPSNLLWAENTGYRASMVGFPCDDLDQWRSIYPADVFIAQLEKVADGFTAASRKLIGAAPPRGIRSVQLRAAATEARLMRAAALHWQSVANQSRCVVSRRALVAAKTADEAEPRCREIEQLLRLEAAAARELLDLQKGDSRLGFEASNQYYYVPMDLAEKILNCRDLAERWLPAQRARFTKSKA